jgi:hypothetical protein
MNKRHFSIDHFKLRDSQDSNKIELSSSGKKIVGDQTKILNKLRNKNKELISEMNPRLLTLFSSKEGTSPEVKSFTELSNTPNDSPDKMVIHFVNSKSNERSSSKRPYHDIGDI